MLSSIATVVDLSCMVYALAYLYYSCICQARMHANETCKLCGKNTCAHANQNARVQLVQTKMHGCSSCKLKCTSEVCANQRCTCTVCANHDVYGSRLTFHVYTRALNVHFHVINLSCTHMLCWEYFHKHVK